MRENCKTVSDVSINEKILYSLGQKFENVKVSIITAKDLSSMSPEELLSMLKIHEVLMKQNEASVSSEFESKVNLASTSRSGESSPRW